MMLVPIGNGCNGINAARLQRASARLVKLQQNLEPDHIRSKPYLQFPNPERESFRRRPDRRRGSILRQSPRKITMWASSRYIANIVRRHGKPGFAFVAFKRNRANLFQPHHDLAFECHAAEVYHARARQSERHSMEPGASPPPQLHNVQQTSPHHRRARNRQHPSPHNPSRHAPTHRRQPVRGANSHNRPRNRVRGANRNPKMRCTNQSHRSRRLGRKSTKRR